MMNNTSKYTITQEPAIYEGIEYSKIVYRDENGEIIQVIDDPPCMIGNEMADILFLFSGVKNIIGLASILKNVKPNVVIKFTDKDFGKFIMEYIKKYFPKKNANKINNNPFTQGEILVCRLGFNPTKKYVGWVLTQQKRMKNIKQN